MNQLNQKKSIGFGFRGWMLILFQAIAYITYQAFTQYPLNILADFYGGANVVSKYYSICAIIGIFIQLILVPFVAKMKNLKRFCCTLGVVSILLAVVISTQPAGPVWYIAYSIENVVAVLYATMTLGLIIGQWFPTRKGTVMGIATLAFPIANGLLGPFAGGISNEAGMGSLAGKVVAAAEGLMATDPAAGGAIFGLLEQGNLPGAAAAAGVSYSAIFNGFLPFLIVSVIGLLIGIIFIKDYPEQVGAFRDNDRNMTPEVANAIMLQEVENKKTSVWTFGRTLASRDFWFATITVALLLGVAIGIMSQTQAIVDNAIAAAPTGIMAKFGYTGVMAFVMVFGIVGSFVLGLIDTAIGTRKAMIISGVIMVIAGVLGIAGSDALLFAALLFVALFMGAASNFGVSYAAQYWRREDFGRVFMVSSPIGSLISSASPMVVAGLLFGATGYKGPAGLFTLVLVSGIVCVACMLLFSPKHVKSSDDKLRAAAGKELDDALVGRK